MHKKHLSILTALALVVSLLAIAAPALAQSTDVGDVQLFLPDNATDKDQLSDAWDGTDNLAHLTAIADPDATQAQFYVCNAGGAIGTNACQLIGTDSSGQTAVPFENRDQPFVSAAAFDVFWDIPANLDSFQGGGQQYDIVVRACVGEPHQTNPSNNCDEDRTASVALDDSSTTNCGGPGQTACTGGEGPQLPTGEITGICYSVTGGAMNAGTGQLNQTDPCGAQGSFQPLAHGDQIPSDDFTIQFRTSAEVAQASACLGTNEGVATQPQFEGALNEPDNCDVYATSTYSSNVVTGGTATTADDYRVWYATFTNNVAAEGTGSSFADVDVAIFGQPEPDNAECIDDFADAADPGNPITDTETDVCVFDEHYAVAAQNVAEAVNASFDLDDNDSSEGDDDGCGPDEDDNDTATNLIFDSSPNDEWVWQDENIEGCVRNQFGGTTTNLSGNQRALFELEGVGSLEEHWFANDCDAQDNDGDGENEIAVCTTTGNIGEGDEFDTFIGPEFVGTTDNIVPGTGTVTFCIDEEGATPTNAQFGCADEENTDVVTKDFVQQAQDVLLVFGNDGVPATESCIDGDQFRTNVVGDTDVLVVCTFSNAGELTSANIAHTADRSNNFSAAGGRGSGRLTWQNSNTNAVAFIENPPQGTRADGTEDLAVRANAPGSSTITVTLTWNDTDGNCCPYDERTVSSSVTKTVTEGPGGGNPQCNDGIDNDGDGKIDFPADPGCASIEDNTEGNEPPPPTVTEHDRTAEITKMRHVDVGKKNPALLIKGKVQAPGFAACHNQVPVSVQIRTDAGWITRKSDTTNENGVFKVLIRDLTAKYRAKAPKYVITDDTANTEDVCLKATSPGRRHRH